MNALFNLTASAIWSVLNGVHRALYQLGWREPIDLGVRVVSVGNIQAGGAGKTPLTAILAREALARGWIPVILTRGYLGERERSGGVLSPGSGEGRLISVAEWGDEPVLLRELVPGAWIGVGADRAEVFRYQVWPRVMADHAGLGESALKARIMVILDDGFQHLRIRRDLELVALTSDRPWHRVFREFSNVLNRADLLVWTKGERPPIQASDLRRVQVTLKVPRPEPHESRATWWLFTGLGDGREVHENLKRAGWKVVRHLEFRDHARYDPEVLRSLLNDMAYAGARALTTGKDWVKWREQGVGTGDAVKVIEPEVEFQEGRERWVAALWGENSHPH